MLNQSDIYKAELEEKVYRGFKDDSEVKLEKNIDDFLDEVLQRKRNDDVEGGLQFSGIINPDGFAFKVNDNDGLSPHGITELNLTRLLNGETNYFTDRAAGYFTIYRDDMRKQVEEAITLRGFCNEDTLFLIFHSHIEMQTVFAAETIKKFIKLCQTKKENRSIANIQFSVHTKDIDFSTEDWTDEFHSSAMNAMNSIKK